MTRTVSTTELSSVVLGLNEVFRMCTPHRNWDRERAQSTSSPTSSHLLFLVKKPLFDFQVNLQGTESPDLTETSGDQGVGSSLDTWPGQVAAGHGGRVCVCVCV